MSFPLILWVTIDASFESKRINELLRHEVTIIGGEKDHISPKNVKKKFLILALEKGRL